MSKRAEEMALKAYPDEMVTTLARGNKFRAGPIYRKGFVKGYEQAEKDLRLTWEDIDNIIRINELYSCEMIHPPYRSKEYCEEVLRRFNDTKK